MKQNNRPELKRHLQCIKFKIQLWNKCFSNSIKIIIDKKKQQGVTMTLKILGKMDSSVFKKLWTTDQKIMNIPVLPSCHCWALKPGP